MRHLYYDSQLIQSVDVFKQGDVHSDDEYMKECSYSGEGQVTGVDSVDYNGKFQVMFVVTDEIGRVFEHRWRMH